jgi:hypothetical protein
MVWNITTVVWNNNTLLIEGYNSNPNDNRLLKTTIEKTDIFTAFNKQRIFHDGTSLSVVKPEEVYVMDILCDKDENAVKRIINKPYVSAEELFFNNVAYMGLPLMVFAHWKGLINTDN